MPEKESYWTRQVMSRRAALRQISILGSGIAVLDVVACSPKGKTARSSNGTTPAALDPTRGKRGGKIIIQQYSDPGGGLELVKIRNLGVHQLAGFTHDGLLEFRNGTPAFPGTDIGTQPDLAQTMPEQPDQQTYVFKLREANFHNGRAVTSDDVKYSYERYAYAPDSAWRADFAWLDRVETPDPQTAVVRTKFPYADALQSMAQRFASEILCREHQESSEAEKKLLGSGAFLFVEYQPPVVTRYRRNPGYHRQPYPYFDEIELLGTSDPTKRVADFIAHNVHMPFWFPAEGRDQIKKARPDAQMWQYPAPSSALFMRTDKPPFSDKRVRQALSLAIDRKALSQAVTQGEGDPDQALSIAGEYWGFRKPKDLGPAAKYWNHDPQAAKQLLSAAGVSLPMKFELAHWNASVVGQEFVDAIVLIEAQWRSAGITDVKDVELTFGQASSTISVGNYEGMQWNSNTLATLPNVGITLRNQFFSPPEGIKGPPTQNLSFANNPRLSALVEKQLGQFNKQERIQTFREIEDILAEEQYRIAGVTSSNTWFGDPSIKNMQPARDAYQGAIPYVKYWWFDR
jgi:ABC-type transport system substrate-binding protein